MGVSIGELCWRALLEISIGELYWGPLLEDSLGGINHGQVCHPMGPCVGPAGSACAGAALHWEANAKKSQLA